MLRTAGFIAAIHIRRSWRLLTTLGLFRVIFLLLLFTFGFAVTLSPDRLPLQALVVTASIAQMHFSRKDHQLLISLSLNTPVYFILLYSLLAIPFLLVYLILNDYKALLILAAGLCLIPLFNRPVKFRKWRLRPSFSYIPADAWEWRAGLKYSWWIFASGWLILMIFHRQDFLFIACIVVFSLLTAGFQMHHESVTMIRALGLRSGQFLKRKIYLQVFLFLVISAPVIISSLILHPEGKTALLMTLLNSILVQAFAVTLKYSGYRQGQHTPYQMTVIFLLSLAFAIPILLPLPLIMLVIYLQRAGIQLKTVIYD